MNLKSELRVFPRGAAHKHWIEPAGCHSGTGPALASRGKPTGSWRALDGSLEAKSGLPYRVLLSLGLAIEIVYHIVNGQRYRSRMFTGGQRNTSRSLVGAI
jgi:hypothetical protein